MLNRDDQQHLASRLYASGMGDVSLVETLGDLSETSGSSAALAQVADECRRNRLLHNYGYAGEFVAEFYTSEYCAKDPRAAYYRTVQPGAH